MKDITVQGGRLPQVRETEGSPVPRTGGSKSFGETLKDSLKEVNDFQLHADHAMQEMAAGGSRNLHETMILLEKADISFRLMMQVRNKLLDAYQEIMRMQI